MICRQNAKDPQPKAMIPKLRLDINSMSRRIYDIYSIDRIGRDGFLITPCSNIMVWISV